MKRRKIIVKVLNPGQCRYYRAGQEFLLGGFAPKGLCDSAYVVTQLLSTAKDEAGEDETFSAVAGRLGAALWRNVPELHVAAQCGLRPQPNVS